MSSNIFAFKADIGIFNRIPQNPTFIKTISWSSFPYKCIMMKNSFEELFMEKTDAYITMPLGFEANGVHSGLKKNGVVDLAFLYSKTPCNVAGVYTKNLVKGHSLVRSMNIIREGKPVHAVLVNSGNANACVGDAGVQDTEHIASEVAKLLHVDSSTILHLSTGVIGTRMPMDTITNAIPTLIQTAGNSEEKAHLAMRAMMTTDTEQKEVAAELTLHGKEISLAGMAKGSGMIHPNLATMISLFTTDANISHDTLQKMISNAVIDTFNRVSVDGDTSVCDSVIIFANGAADAPEIKEGTEEYDVFFNALHDLCFDLARSIAADGEGATKCLEVEVLHALSDNDAYLAVVSVCRSPLVKTMFFGCDANWGRIMTAIGYSGANFDPNKVTITIGGVQLCENGSMIGFDEALAKEVLEEKDIHVIIDLNQGDAHDRMFTCDYSYDYVKINGSYRS